MKDFIKKNDFVISTILIVLFSIFIFLPFFIYTPLIQLSMDTFDYSYLAKLIFDGNLPVKDLKIDLPVGYPIIIYIVKAAGLNFNNLVFFQLIFYVLSFIFLCFQLSKFTKFGGLITGITFIFFSFNSHTIRHIFRISPDSFYSSFIVILVGGLFYYFRSKNKISIVVIILSIGGAVLIRSNGIYLFFVLTIILFRKTQTKENLKFFLICFINSVLIISSLNYSVKGVFAPCDFTRISEFIYNKFYPKPQFLRGIEGPKGSSFLTWEINGNESSWKVKYSDLKTGEIKTINVLSNRLRLSEKSLDTNIVFYVQSIYSSKDSSLFAGPKRLKTNKLKSNLSNIKNSRFNTTKSYFLSFLQRHSSYYYSIQKTNYEMVLKKQTFSNLNQKFFNGKVSINNTDVGLLSFMFRDIMGNNYSKIKKYIFFLSGKENIWLYSIYLIQETIYYLKFNLIFYSLFWISLIYQFLLYMKNKVFKALHLISLIHILSLLLILFVQGRYIYRYIQVSEFIIYITVLSFVIYLVENKADFVKE